MLLKHELWSLVAVCCVLLSDCSRSHDIDPPSLSAADGRAGGGALTGNADAGANEEDAGEPPAPPPLVQIANGPLQGKNVGDTREFLGIPYAKAPQGALRFAPPQAAERWMEMRDASTFGPACPQGKSTVAMMGPQSEDCLSLNVFMPAAALQGPALPVLVFIHGGAFVTGGSGSTRPELLANAGPIVVVTINYRLGALGYLSLPALDASRPGAPSGSDGIRDQQLALRWVQDNIASFGGDPKNVSVMGESAGAMSACVHLLSPSSQALRQRVIMESGVCLSGSLAGNSKQKSSALSQALADELCAGQSDQLACLRAQPLDALMNWGYERTLFGAGWGPTIEGEGGVLPAAPEQLIARASMPAPFILGVNADEWAFFQLTSRDGKAANLSGLHDAIVYNFGEAAAPAIEAQYPAPSDEEANEVYVQLMTDAKLRCPTRTFARLMAARGGSPYVYSFEATPAYHSAELEYVWGSPLLSAFGRGPLMQAMQGYWTGFAIDGRPHAAAAPDWPAYTREVAESYLVLNDELSSGAPFAPQCDFWDGLNSAGAGITPL
jgi:para-nitrobenzyl esterase